MDFAYIIFGAALLLPMCMGQDPTIEPLKFELQISPSDNSQFYKLGDSRVLTCQSSETEDGQKAALHWEINGGKITSTQRRDRIYTEEASSGLMLRIADVQDGDGGEYKCVGSLNGQTDSRSVSVEVYKALEVLSEPDQFGILGEDGEVECDARGKPVPSITWKFENYTKIINSEKYVIQSKKLIIKDLTFADNQRYLCDILVLNMGTGQSFFINYQVVKLPTIALPPTIQPNNPKVGDEVKITCEADGVPKPKYQFKRGDNLLPESEVDEVNGILTLKDLKKEDEATYTCIAKNIGGSAEKSNTLDVKIPPVIEAMTDIPDAVEAGQESITCVAQGDPEPSVVWMKENGPTYANGGNENGPEIVDEGSTDLSTAEIKTVRKTIKFNPVEAKHAGTYICTAVNVVGNTSQSVKFDVRYKPHFDTNFKQTKFYGWKGHTANITCLTSSNDQSSIEWYKSDPAEPENIDKATRIKNESPYTITTTVHWNEYHLSSRSLLVVISGDDRSAYGNYLCRATNSMGSNQHLVQLVEAFPPSQPGVTIANVLSTMVTVDVTPPAESHGRPVTGYRYEYNPDDDPTNIQEQDIEKNGESTRIELRNLQPLTSYVVRVSAKNDVGHGEPGRVSVTTLDVSKPFKLTFSSPSEGKDAYSYSVNWEEPDDGGSPIKEYIIKYKRVEVAGDDPTTWKVTKDVDEEFTIKRVTNPSARSFTLDGLNQDTFYDVRISAVNEEGESDPEFKIIKTSKTDGTRASQSAQGIGEGEVTKKDNADEKGEDEVEQEGGEEEKSENEEDVETLGKSSDPDADTGTAGLSSGAIIGIVVLLLILLIIILVVVFIRKKPEVVERLRGRIGGKGGEEERGKKEDGKDPAEEEKLIKKDDTVKVETETEEGKPEQVIEEQPEEFEPDSKPEAKPEPEAAPEAAPEKKAEELSTPAPTTEIKITPETPEKPDNPPV